MSGLAFAPCTGAVEVSRMGCSENDFLTIKIGAGTNFTSEFILQGVSLELSGNYQFLHTVDDFVYFYAFGDRVGSLTVRGIGFLRICPPARLQDTTKKGAAILELYDYYNNNKAIARRGMALDIVLTAPSGHSIQLYGFLTGMRMDINQEDSGPIGSWILRFDVLPKKSEYKAPETNIIPQTGGEFLAPGTVMV